MKSSYREPGLAGLAARYLAATDIVNRAMFCPECKCEYRPGFTHCSDCDVALVPQLPDASAVDFEKLKNVWTGKDQERCLELCEDFKAAGIPFNVDQRRRQYLRGLDEKHTIAVSPEFFEKARKIIKGR